MEDGLFAYILKYSKRQQVILILMTVLSFPFYYLSLDLPKTIINEAISGTEFPVDIGFAVFGFSVQFASLQQVPYLVLLCLVFLALVLINSGFKYFINIYRGTLGERMLRRMRLQLVERIMKFPLARFRRTSQGELVAMVNQETEPLGGFIGEAFSLPLYQGGMLLTILIFMFVQDWKLGLAAIALYPLQAWLIPKLQMQVNLLNRERTVHLRNLAENLGEVVAGINEIHINDNSTFYKDHFSKLLGGIFNIRVKIYRKKFFIKFLNNSIAQVTPFLFFLVGGMLVIQGNMSVGALVAALAAYKDLSPPWKELLAWYQGQADARMKFTILTEQFYFPSNEAPRLESLTPKWVCDAAELPIVVKNVSLKRHDGMREIDNVSLSMDRGEWVCLVGTGNSGKNGLAQMLAGLLNPSSGKILIADQDFSRVPELTMGRMVSYVGHDSYIFSVSILDNLLLSIKFRPQETLLTDTSPEGDISFRQWADEARLSGNSEVAFDADWVDHKSAGVENAHELGEVIGGILRDVEVEDELVRYALERKINPDDHPELTGRILQARSLFKERVIAEGLESVVDFLDPEHYNDNASLAENILFGISTHEMLSVEGLTEHPILRTLLIERGLAKTLDDAASNVAQTMVELFSGLPPGHEFFDRYSFIDADDLPRLKTILGLLEKNSSMDQLEISDRKLIRSLPFKLIRGRHRLGVLQEEDKIKVLQVRKSFANALDAESSQQIDFFSPEDYNASTPIGENILFGRVVFGRLGAEDKVYNLILEVLRSLDLITPLLEIGLSAPSGLAGGLLPVSQRQKLVLARALIKQPKVLVVNEGLNALDAEETERILFRLKQRYPLLSLVWVDNQPRFPSMFDRVAYLKSGKLMKLEETSPRDKEADPVVVSPRVRTADSVMDDEKISLLSSIPLFRFLDYSHLALLSNNCDTMDFSLGDRLFNQGDDANALYIIIEGKASVLITDGEMEREVREVGINEVIGELALLSNEPRSASIEAITDLTVFRLERDTFVDILQTNSDIGFQILQVVADRLITTNREMISLIPS
ncbi:ABC transporter transmembrane domain-containing protein [Granulosicoccus antarcticus]|uniref:Multidrug export ATP-binding/permease protein n=1 Tax=Granulosicoccus antarcticus IMCC3135 TaxID=1192854 RepID=A0A2Z2NJX0_9GAMM|nr:ABC transporter transmembrane domain-containing protein [Granulosicoccus antarcticus]ASJ70805.1 Putative multidrug export ATP-binding/permease protein [Granulosicoccus antarcticus IMCC3135]